MRHVVAAALIQEHRFRRRTKIPTADFRAICQRAFLDINKDVGQFAVRHLVIFALEVWTFLRADRVGGSINLFRRRGRSVESDRSGNRALIALADILLGSLLSWLGRTFLGLGTTG